MNSRQLLAALLITCGLGAPCVTAEGETAAAAGQVADEIVRLPAFRVEDHAIPPPMERGWYHAAIPGIEIFSHGAKTTAQELAAEYQTLDQVLQIVWPKTAANTLGKTTIILCGETQFNAFLPETDRQSHYPYTYRLLHDDEQDILLLSAAAGLTKGHRLQYLRMRLARLAPEMPPWLREGLAQVTADMEIDKDEIVIGRVSGKRRTTSEEDAFTGEHSIAADDVSAGLSIETTTSTVASIEDEEQFNVFFNHQSFSPDDIDTREMIPFAEMFGPEPVDNRRRMTWRMQCWAFTHLCLYGHNQAFIGSFRTLIENGVSGSGALTEEKFKDAFKLSFAEMQTELRNYTQWTEVAAKRLRAKKGHELKTPLPVEFSEVQDADLAVAKSEAYRLAGRIEEARNECLAAYRRDQRPPVLIGTLGALEMVRAQGDLQHARALLETAFASGESLPAFVCRQLVRSRLAEAQARERSGQRALNAAQTSSVLKLLFMAAQQKPVAAETYRLLVEAWEMSPAKPSRGDLAVIREGLQLYPNDTWLVEHGTMLLNKNAGVEPAAH